MSKPRKAVIFDMDGVIVDSEPRHERAFLEVVEAIGFGQRHGLRFADYVGRSDKELWIDFVRLNSPVQTLDELLALKRARVVEIIQKEKPVFLGLVELVQALAASVKAEPRSETSGVPRKCRYKLGLASGSERAIVDEVLRLDGLGRFFAATVSGSDVCRGKPAPDIFLKTATLLGVEPDECWVVEDSKPGVAAGLAAGMKVIAITNTHPADELTQANFVVSSYGEIGEVIRQADG